MRNDNLIWKLRIKYLFEEVKAYRAEGEDLFFCEAKKGAIHSFCQRQNDAPFAKQMIVSKKNEHRVNDKTVPVFFRRKNKAFFLRSKKGHRRMAIAPSKGRLCSFGDSI